MNEPQPRMRVRVPSLSLTVIGTVTHCWELKGGWLVSILFDEPVFTHGKLMRRDDVDWRRCEVIQP